MLFSCHRCGVCCRSLLIKWGQWKLGLFLLPAETQFFPEELLSPMWGVGIKGRSRPRPSDVGVFQLNVNVCPQLTSNNDCKIYSKRPLVCQAHPLSLVMDQAVPISASVDISCHFAMQIPGGSKVKLSDYFSDEILKANAVCCSYLESIKKQSDVWLFDLETNKWKRVR